MDDDRRAARPDGDDARRSDASADGPSASGVAPANSAGDASAAASGHDAPDDEYDDPFRRPIEPESVEPEHAAFVLLGAILTVAIVASAL